MKYGIKNMQSTEKYREQVKLLEELQEIGYNIINCNMCSAVNIVEKNKETFKCYDCSEIQEHHDCPDLFY